MSVAWTLADHHALQRATQAAWASVPPHSLNDSSQLYQQRFVIKPADVYKPTDPVVGRSKTQGEAARVAQFSVEVKYVQGLEDLLVQPAVHPRGTRPDPFLERLCCFRCAFFWWLCELDMHHPRMNLVQLRVVYVTSASASFQTLGAHSKF